MREALDCSEKLLQSTPQPSAQRLSDTWEDVTVASSSILRQISFIFSQMSREGAGPRRTDSPKLSLMTLEDAFFGGGWGS